MGKNRNLIHSVFLRVNVTVGDLNVRVYDEWSVLGLISFLSFSLFLSQDSSSNRVRKIPETEP